MEPTTEPNVVTRSHPRTGAHFMVKLQLRGRPVLAKAHDISMAGLRVEGQLDGLGDTVRVAIPLPGDREVVTMAQVRWRSEDEAALELTSLDWDDLFALARFVSPRI